MVRIVAAADEVESGFLHVAHVALESGVADGVAPARAVLMHVRAVEIAVPAVEEESLVGGPFDRAESEVIGVAVVDHAGLRVGHDGLRAVQVRRLGRPPFGVLHLRRDDLDLHERVRRHLDAGFGSFRHEAAILIVDAGHHVDRACFIGLVADLVHHADGRVAVLEFRRGDAHAVPCDVQVALHDQRDVAVDAAGERVLAGARREACVPQVVHAHRHQVFAVDHLVREIDLESGVAALVMPGELAVHVHVGDLKDALEVKIIPVALVRLGGDPAVADHEIHIRHVEFLPVPAVARVEAFGEEVRQAERMRDMGELPLAVVQVDRLSVLDRAELEFPFGVEVADHASARQGLSLARHGRARHDGLRVRLGGAEDHDSGAEDRADAIAMK